LPDDRQREVVREFRDLCAGLNDPENLHPVVRGDIQARMERGSRTPFMQDRAALILRLVIDLACWRHPQRLSSSIDPPTTDFHVDLGADAESDTPFLSATVRERGITL